MTATDGEKTTERVVAVVTTSRADYSHLYWVLRELEARPSIEVRLIVTGAHLEDEFGAATREIERDGFEVAERVPCLDSADTDAGMARTIGRAVLGLTEVLERMRPDLLLLIADRYEMLAPASVALALRIPLAHIEGGDVSEGAIDDAVRNALTKMSHLHFTPTETARRRVLAMGEEPWRVHRSGAPSLDHLRHRSLMTREEIERELGVSVPRDGLLVAYHPVTIARDTLRETDALLDALVESGRPLRFCFPNADAGGRRLAQRVRELCGAHSDAHVFVNLNPWLYWNLLAHSGAMIGNSSSGIMESPSLGIPCINVGIRQQGRERAANILDVEADRARIRVAIDRGFAPAFRRTLRDVVNPYGDGRAGDRIAAVLETTVLGEKLLLKRTRPDFGAEV